MEREMTSPSQYLFYTFISLGEFCILIICVWMIECKEITKDRSNFQIFYLVY